MATPRAPRRRGFTLLELLVVLTIIAGLSALVAPAAWRALESAERRGQKSDLHAALSALPLRAFEQGRNLSLDGKALSEFVPSLPGDCRVLTTKPLQYAANGMASGGRVELRCEGTRTEFEVTPVTGTVRREDSAGQ